jgi:hypothetical protein
MEHRDLAMVALRVLSGWTPVTCHGMKSCRSFAHCLTDEMELAPDEMACRLIGRACAAVIEESQGDRKEISRNFRHRKKA